MIILWIDFINKVPSEKPRVTLLILMYYEVCVLEFFGDFACVVARRGRISFRLSESSYDGERVIDFLWYPSMPSFCSTLFIWAPPAATTM